MAEALIRGIIAAHLYKPQDVLVSDIKAERLDHLARQYHVTPMPNNADLAAKADVVVLSVKPQNMADALDSIKTAIGTSKLVISIAAGIKVAGISAVLGNTPTVRVMPNTPALVGEGASAIFANDQAKPLLDKAIKMFSAVGKTVVLNDEALIDAVTALSGSGPAYFFLLMEEMIKTGIALGLPDDIAKDLVLQTAKGAGVLAVEADELGQSPADLRRKVTSPGGTTEAALRAFAQANFSDIVAQSLRAACNRSRELSG